MNKLYQEITEELKRNGNEKRVITNKKFHKYEIRELGVESLVRHKVLKQFKTRIRDLNCKEAMGLARKLYAEEIEEFAVVANYILDIKSDCFSPKQFSYLDKNSDYFKSWSTTDDFCNHFFDSILLKYPKEAVILVRKWNKSKNIWKRRASVVAFTRKIGESGKFTNMVLELCNNLINDKEDLVRKGVGWALKDNMRGNKKKVITYIKNLRKKKISSTIILYAIRDLRDNERKEILQI